MLVKIFGYLIGAILLFWAIGFALGDPAQAGHDVHNVITGIFTFFGAVSK